MSVQTNLEDTQDSIMREQLANCRMTQCDILNVLRLEIWAHGLKFLGVG